MEKLIELLNEYAPEDFNWCVIDGKIFDKEDRCGTIMNVEMGVYVISKQFGFIKWLVENKKIDEKKIDTRLVRYVESYYDEEGHWIESSYEDYSYTNTLLMILAISDTPINDLISYLK